MARVKKNVKKICYQIRDPYLNDLEPKAREKIRILMANEIFPTIYNDFDEVKICNFNKTQKNDDIEYLIYETVEDFKKDIKDKLKRNRNLYELSGKKLYKKLKLYLGITKTVSILFQDDLYN